tara:strand:+ start:1068 stop:1322 length:255 start_codon:yes stop_codon:yes gene_type:complete
MIWIIFLWLIAFVVFFINRFTVKAKDGWMENQIMWGGFLSGLVIGGIGSTLSRNWIFVLYVVPLFIILSISGVYFSKLIQNIRS